MLKKTALAVAALGVAGGIAIGGQTFAQAATTTPTASASATTVPAATAPNHTAVTGAAATAASAAVKVKDPAVTVTSVRKDADGSYDVLGTKAGVNVMYDVSADLKTITQSTGGHGGGSADTLVTGSEAATASAAVTAKDSAVTVTSVRKDADGSYDVLGTKAGVNVMYDVSADLKTITLNTHSGGHGHDAATTTPTAAA